jgi:hypothetical protein
MEKVASRKQIRLVEKGLRLVVFTLQALVKVNVARLHHYTIF